MSAPDRYAVFGHPVGHSRSPGLHARFAELTGQLITYEAIDVPPDGFAAALERFLATGGKGLNITVPHKLAAFDAADVLTPRAQHAGAVNTLALQAHGLLGDNTDGAGLLRDLQHNLEIPLAGRRILLVGAGGAARGVLGPLLGAEPAVVVIANRSPRRAEELATRFASDGPVSGIALDGAQDTFDLVINATSASLSDEVPALDTRIIGARTFCYDLAYGTGLTAFLRWASAHGCAAVADGLGMLVEQAAESFELWRGVRPPTAQVLTELRDAMARP